MIFKIVEYVSIEWHDKAYRYAEEAKATTVIQEVIKWKL